MSSSALKPDTDAAPARTQLPEPPKMRVVVKGWWVREKAPQSVETLRAQDLNLKRRAAG